MKKAGGFSSGLRCKDSTVRLERKQVVTRLFDGLCNGALLFGGKVSVLARQNLAGVSNVVAHSLGRGERDLLRREALLGVFGRAHLKKEKRKTGEAKGCQPAIQSSR
jgi:hypothetical protein